MLELVSRDPATGLPVGAVPVTPVDAIDAIVARARAAQPAWAALGADGRAACLAPLAAALRAAEPELARLITREMGKPVRDATGEVRAIADGLGHELAEMVAALAPTVVEDDRVSSTIVRDPLGVCAAITPWNFPVAMPHWMVLPALVAGNTVVLKPSEDTPLTGAAYAALVQALVPPDVLQVIHGADEQGKALVAADVELIAFTGSRAVGKHIMAAAAGGLKRLVLELGGKDPLLVLSDADVDAAAGFAARNSFRNAGQMCIATERIYVERAVAERFVARLVAEAGKYTVGNGLDPATRVGPLVNDRQRDHVVAQLASAVADGARVVHGGGHRDRFVEPTVVVDVRPDMAIARDETFGPIACVAIVDDADAAVTLANDSRYALGAVVYGEPTRAAAIAERLTAGMIGINQGVYGARGTPWVGARESGFGFHSSPDGHRQFAQTRVRSRPR